MFERFIQAVSANGSVRKKKFADTPQNKLLKISGKLASLELLPGCNLLQPPAVIKNGNRHFRIVLLR